MLFAYTCVGKMCKARTYTLVAYTCSGQMSKNHAYTLVAYTCGGQMSKGLAHLLPMGITFTTGSLGRDNFINFKWPKCLFLGLFQ